MSGCRTRITNNNEVSNVYYDEDGFLTETYQMRRDELGLSTAEKPILPDLGSGDTEDDFDSAEDSNFNYDPGRHTTSSLRQPTPPTTAPAHAAAPAPPEEWQQCCNATEKIKIAFDPGKRPYWEQKRRRNFNRSFKKGSKFKIISADRDGYTLESWNYPGSKKPISPGKEVTAEKDMKYTAVWKKANKEQWTITFDTDGGDEIQPAKVDKDKPSIQTPNTKRRTIRNFRLER